MLKTLATLAAVPMAAAALALTGAGAASASVPHFVPASSYGCDNNTFGYCGDEEFTLLAAGDRVFAVSGAAKVGAAVVVEDHSDSSSQDFWAENYNGLNNSKVFEYAPNGRRSGLCIANTRDAVNWKLRLNTCNFGPGQTFTPLEDPLDSSVYAWVGGRNSNLVITDPGDGGPGTQLEMSVYNNYDSQNTEWTG